MPHYQTVFASSLLTPSVAVEVIFSQQSAAQVKVVEVRCAMEAYIKGMVYSLGKVGWGRDHLNTLVGRALAHFKARFGGQHAVHDEFIKYITDHYAKRPGANASVRMPPCSGPYNTSLASCILCCHGSAS